MVFKPMLHLPRSSYDFSVFGFPYDFLEIVGESGLRRMCLQFIRASYDFLICLSFVDVLIQKRKAIVRKS